MANDGLSKGKSMFHFILGMVCGVILLVVIFVIVVLVTTYLDFKKYCARQDEANRKEEAAWQTQRRG